MEFATCAFTARTPGSLVSPPPTMRGCGIRDLRFCGPHPRIVGRVNLQRPTLLVGWMVPHPRIVGGPAPPGAPGDAAPATEQTGIGAIRPGVSLSDVPLLCTQLTEQAEVRGGRPGVSPTDVPPLCDPTAGQPADGMPAEPWPLSRPRPGHLWAFQQEGVAGAVWFTLRPASGIKSIAAPCGLLSRAGGSPQCH